MFTNFLFLFVLMALSVDTSRFSIFTLLSPIATEVALDVIGWQAVWSLCHSNTVDFSIGI
jgi:hypothetical protein